MEEVRVGGEGGAVRGAEGRGEVRGGKVDEGVEGRWEQGGGRVRGEGGEEVGEEGGRVEGGAEGGEVLGVVVSCRFPFLKKIKNKK